MLQLEPYFDKLTPTKRTERLDDPHRDRNIVDLLKQTGTLSGPIDTYLVPQILSHGLGEWEIGRVFGNFPISQTHSDSVAPWEDYLAEHWGESIF